MATTTTACHYTLCLSTFPNPTRSLALEICLTIKVTRSQPTITSAPSQTLEQATLDNQAQVGLQGFIGFILRSTGFVLGQPHEH